ncbi:hypothetical protein HD806DRAFT_424638 [Xylariaceae sp. AK1471]|nr:hypothetical protein HD806DRAFT_424638 [Xylariaceae sp. AK1471]
MNIQQVLKIPKGEIEFTHPGDAPPDSFDRSYATLRVERRGLRKWETYEEKPSYVQDLMKRPTGLPADWRPVIDDWDRFAASELSVADLLKKTVIQRVKIALNIVSPGTSIVGTPAHFQSYGSDDNRIEGGFEKRIGPDLVMLDGGSRQPPNLQDFQKYIVAIGDIKVKQVESIKHNPKILPGTIGIYESWLAQPVQCCIDLNIPIGFVLTNVEVVFFHLCKLPDFSTTKNDKTTRASKTALNILETLPSDATLEPEYSSPIVRYGHDWLDFYDGDAGVPLITHRSFIEQQWATPIRSSHATIKPPETPQRFTSLLSSPLARKRSKGNHLDSTRSSQEDFNQPPSSSPDPRTERNMVSLEDLPSSWRPRTVSPSDYEVDNRGDDPTHILIRSYPVEDNEDLGEQLFGLLTLALRMKKNDLLKIGAFKHSHSALDVFELRE